ncbi:hypothetical protein EJ05DRAFT_337825 [Pseudovirgaria hyperparasitica]|uniref:RING-type domain-containing protein n=1 Tax=Pseudovirgaria hyperparasitica TaxID=470096 RepID=A0A6A6W9J6_9PEZI|nr:uncharacterized protein EJ05DRAFT_337825 [Pseudovirgaria hyperparasitica]KAF2759235.1 hypothetical protein EJ05DRAFT_337825 [Pseudovirgaria hyperparasitica]
MDTRPSPTPTGSRSKVTASSSNPANNLAQTSTPPPSAAIASSSKQPRRPSISSDTAFNKAVENKDKPTRTASSISLKSKGSKKLDESATLSKNEELLKGYSEDFASLRSIITCKICDKLLYEPYVVACGHIYCYSCLSHWFVNNKKRKTCPDCRTLVTQVPSPAYLIREMTTIFINRAEYLPVGESLEQHKAWRAEEAEAVQKDRENDDPRLGGLFKGVFRSNLSRLGPRRAIRDFEDNVDRCPFCTWELEEGSCQRCGFEADDIEFHLDAIDVDESDMGGSSEDMDRDIDIGDDYMDEDDFPDEDDLEGTGDLPYSEEAYMDEADLVVSQWLNNHPAAARAAMPAGLARRRPAAHSAAGGRQRYSASIASASDMYGTEDLEMLEEEEEEDMDDEDSSMSGFLDDRATEQMSDASGSTNSQTPQPPISSQSSQRRRARNRRVVESETSSIGPRSTQADDDDDDDEEGGPVRPGRQRRQQRVLSRANGGSHRVASSISTDASADHDLDEDTQRLLSRHGWSPLQHGPEEDVEEGQGDESDGGRTTVGPTLQARPRSRIGQTRFPDGSRGLRRRSSILSVSTSNYEDGEADDDDSEMDRDGDTVMNGGQLRNRNSRIRLHGPFPSSQPGRSTNTLTLGDGLDGEDDDNSDDTSIQSPRRRQLGQNRQEYNPRISWMFAQHQNEMQAALTQQINWLEELRSTTPIARPRTANRNRNAQSITPTPFSPLSNNVNPLTAPSDLSPRTRRADRQSFHMATNAESTSRSERTGSVSSNLSTTDAHSFHNGVRLDRETSVGSVGSGSTLRSTFPSPDDRHRPSNTMSSVPPGVTSFPMDPIERPASRLPARPPSSSSRRGSQSFMGTHPGLQIAPGSSLGGPGLNFAQRTWQSQTRNPYSAFIGMHGNAPRPRQSSQRLREQSSTATLRPSTSRRALRTQQSRADVRDEVAPTGAMRAQRSRMTLRAQPSVQRLHSQPSTRTLRQNDGVQLSPINSAATGAGPGTRANPTSTSGLSVEERQRRANELVQGRLRELRATNPFAPNSRRPSISSNPGTPAQGSIISNGANRFSAGGAYVSMNTSHPPTSTPASASSTNQGANPPSPTINRRRSTRNIGLQTGANSSIGSNTSLAGVRQRLTQPAAHDNVVASAPASRVLSAASYAS